MLYTPTTEDVEKMNRTDLVFEMAKHAHIDHYKRIIQMPTEAIRSLLKHYKNPPEAYFISMDFGFDSGMAFAFYKAGEALTAGDAVMKKTSLGGGFAGPVSFVVQIPKGGFHPSGSNGRGPIRKLKVK